MSKLWKIFIIIGITILFAIIFIVSCEKKSTPKTIDLYKQLEQRIDSLNDSIAILTLQKDSILNSIHKSETKVITINNWYEKKLIDIDSQSVASDVEFFTDYLSKTSK